MPPPKNRPTKKHRERKVPALSTDEEVQRDVNYGTTHDKNIPVNEEPLSRVATIDDKAINKEEERIEVTEHMPDTTQQVEIEGREDSNKQKLSETDVDIDQIRGLEGLENAQGSPSDSFMIEDEDSLSVNLTRLNTPNGAEVILIGTAHFSLKSVQDVRRVIQSVKPSSVILELCQERSFMLNLDEQSLLEEHRTLSFEKVRNAFAEKGIAHGLIYIMFIKMSATLTERMGMAPGAEFRAGSAEAQKIPGCSLILGDRSLRVTIARAVASVSLWQKLKLIYHVLTSDVNITQEDVEKCKDKDMLEQLLEELGGQFPGFKRVLLDERNIYLAHSIYGWAQNSESIMGSPKIVAIVGIGHVAGIVENWGKTTSEQICSLREVPEPSRTEIVVKKTIKYCAIALLIYVGYRALTPSQIQADIHEKIADKITSLRS